MGLRNQQYVTKLGESHKLIAKLDGLLWVPLERPLFLKNPSLWVCCWLKKISLLIFSFALHTTLCQELFFFKCERLLTERQYIVSLTSIWILPDHLQNEFENESVNRMHCFSSALSWAQWEKKDKVIIRSTQYNLLDRTYTCKAEVPVTIFCWVAHDLVF